MREGWEIKKLGDVCDFQNGFAFKSSTFKPTGVPLVRITNIQNQIIETSDLVYVNTSDYTQDLSRFEVKIGDLLIAMSGATTGKIGILQEDVLMLLNQRVGKFLPKFSLKKQYLYYYLLTKAEESLSISAGSAQPNLSTEQIRNFQIPVPPLAEQERIVAMLDEAFAAIDQAKANLERNLQNARELFQSRLNQIFTEKGEGWVEKRLGDVCEYHKISNLNRQLPYIGLENIEANTGKLVGELNHIPESNTFYFNSDYVLYGRLRPYLNKVYLPDFEGHCSTEIFPIKTNKELLREYLFYWIMSPKVVDKINKTSTGARMPRANMNEVLNFQFSFPNTSEQGNLSKELDYLKENCKLAEDTYRKRLDILLELKQSLLQKAFSGELTAKEVAKTAAAVI